MLTLKREPFYNMRARNGIKAFKRKFLSCLIQTVSQLLIPPLINNSIIATTVKVKT